MSMFVGATPSEVDPRILEGREILYSEANGLFTVARQLIDRLEVPNTQLPHREAFVTLPEAQCRYELYTTRTAGGLAIKRVVGSPHINLEIDTLTLPPSGFVSAEHILKRSSSRGRSERLVPPVVTLRPLGETMVDTSPSDALDYYLKNYLQVATSMRDQLSKINLGE